MSFTQSQQELAITHDNTPTTKKVRSIENKLTRELNTIVTKIRTHINPLQATQDLETKFKPLYEQQVYDLIRTAATNSFITGMEYVTNLPIFKNLHSYLLAEDIQYIETLTEEYVARFWGRVAITVGKKQTKIFGTTITISREQGISEPKQTFLNTKYISEFISIGVTNKALNQATIDKMRYFAEHANPITFNLPIPNLTKNLVQFVNTQEETENEQEILANIDNTTAVVGTATSILLLTNIINTAANVKLMWVTSRDERVCPLCRPLHGKKFTLFDNSVLFPPIHERCRCRLIVLTNNNQTQ